MKKKKIIIGKWMKRNMNYEFLFSSKKLYFYTHRVEKEKNRNSEQTRHTSQIENFMQST